MRDDEFLSAADAVFRQYDSGDSTEKNEVARINEVADELNREAEETLEYQVPFGP